MAYVSDHAVDGVLQQYDSNHWQPLAFFSMRLTLTQKRYITYDRELFAIYSAVKLFQYHLEGREFTIYTDHKSPIFDFNLPSNNASPRQVRHVDFISQYITTIRTISGKNNLLADALSRIDEIYLPPPIYYAAIATAQDRDQELTKLISLSNYNGNFDKLPFHRIGVHDHL
ncbi:retrovirus-related Pol polyprotein from transposon 297-like Protein [Trichonephila inaurata madagascariensis]|uniref:Retrovirus-related Pol polyprotein from transposon 297-like Protein n=1 Tax=Trichonephila inaurata madagascariensis TaxID=2747483 RepID=A0A8X6ILH1_9ARAC|nr:retrovirus-related Pol polyprotein from transposon 297-like Protein [Trichonephila inaurata madagascariensis]